MGLLDYADAARKKLAGLLGDMPLVQMAHGRAEMPTMSGLLASLKAMPVFSPDAGQSAYDAALNIGPMGLGKIVYHGSPHKFDKFDSSKIGTGEGAQAYGHGLYLADSPTVAAGYKETLSARAKDRLTIDGKVVDPDSMFGRAAEDVPRIGLLATLQKIDDNIKFNEKYAPDMAEMYRGIREKIASLDPSRVSVKEGALYKVDLPDDAIARMLDWDKPLSGQPEAVRKALGSFKPKFVDGMDIGGSKIFSNANGAVDPSKPYPYILVTGDSKFGLSRGDVDRLIGQSVNDATGAQAWQRAVNELGAQGASGLLRQAGIPGIRYLDGGSRGNGKGSYNYVVFPGLEDQVKILERNGVPLGLLGGN